MIPVYATAVAAISDYILRVRSLILSPDGGQALFTNLNGKRLTRQGFWKIVKGYAEQAGITKEITLTPFAIPSPCIYWRMDRFKGHPGNVRTCGYFFDAGYVHLLNDHFKEV